MKKYVVELFCGVNKQQPLRAVVENVINISVYLYMDRGLNVFKYYIF